MSKNLKNSEYVFTMRNKSKKKNQDGGLSFGRKKSDAVKAAEKAKLPTTTEKLFRFGKKKKSEKVEKNDHGDKFLNPCTGKDFYLDPALVDNLTERSFTISNFGKLNTFTDVLKLGLLNFSFYVNDEKIDFIKFSYKKDKDFESIRDKLTTKLSDIEFSGVKDSSLEKRIYTTDIITKIEISEQKYESYKSKIKNAAIGNVSGFFNKKTESIKFKTIYNFKRDRKITTKMFSLNDLFKEKIKQYKNQKFTKDASKDINFIKMITDILKTKEVFGKPSINVYDTCKSWEDNVNNKQDENKQSLYSTIYYDGFNDTIMFDEDAPKSIRITYKTIRECAKKFNTKDTKISYRAPLTRSEIYDFLGKVNETVIDILGSTSKNSLSELFNKKLPEIKEETYVQSLDKRLKFSNLEKFIKNYLSYHPATLISSKQTLNISMKDTLGEMYVTTLISESVKKSKQLLSIIDENVKKEAENIVKSLEPIPNNIKTLNKYKKYTEIIALGADDYKNKEDEYMNIIKIISNIIGNSKTIISNIDEEQLNENDDKTAASNNDGNKKSNKTTVKEKLNEIKTYIDDIKAGNLIPESYTKTGNNLSINELKEDILSNLAKCFNELSKKREELFKSKKEESQQKLEKIASTKGIGEDDKIYTYLEYFKKKIKEVEFEYDKGADYDFKH